MEIMEEQSRQREREAWDDKEPLRREIRELTTSLEGERRQFML